MAIYHMSVKTGSRGKGQSAVASASYRSAEMLVDERTGEVFDYRRKEGVVAQGILAPDGSPEWVRDRSELWNAVEAAEKRKDARTFREFEMALPKELTDQQQRELVVSWVDRELLSRGMVCDLNFHDKGDGNPHVHIMATTRNLAEDGSGFAGKNRDWDKKEVLKEWRRSWAQECNQSLEMAGHESRVDHRSHRERGIEMEPQIHHGGRSGIMAKNEAIKSRNTERKDIPRQAAELVAIASARAEQERQRQAEEAAKEKARLEQEATERAERERAAQERSERRAREIAEAEARDAARAEREREVRRQIAERREQARRDAEAKAKQEQPTIREVLRESIARPAEEAAAREKASVDVPLAKTPLGSHELEVASILEQQLQDERRQLREQIEAADSRGMFKRWLAPVDPAARERLAILDRRVSDLWDAQKWLRQGGFLKSEYLAKEPTLAAEVERWKRNHDLAVKHGLVKSEEQMRQEAIKRAQDFGKASAREKDQEKARTQNRGRSGPSRGGPDRGGGMSM